MTMHRSPLAVGVAAVLALCCFVPFALLVARPPPSFLLREPATVETTTACRHRNGFFPQPWAAALSSFYNGDGDNNDTDRRERPRATTIRTAKLTKTSRGEELSTTECASATCWGPADAPIIITSVFAFDEARDDTVECIRRNRLAYADKYGLAYCEYVESLVTAANRPAKWSRYVAVPRLLDVAPTVMYLDADAFFLDFNRSLIDYVEQYKQFDIIWTGDYIEEKINSGVFLARNTSWARDFLHRVSISSAELHNGSDQNTVKALLALNTTDSDIHTTKLKHREMQTIPWHPYGWWKNNPELARRVSRSPVPLKEDRDNTFIAHHTYGYGVNADRKYETIMNYLGCWSDTTAEVPSDSVTRVTRSA